MSEQIKAELRSRGWHEDKIDNFVQNHELGIEGLVSAEDLTLAERVKREDWGAKKIEPPKPPDNALMDFLGNTLWGFTSAATFGLAEKAVREDEEGKRWGVVDPFGEETGWGMAGRAIGEAAGFLLPMKYIGKSTKAVVRAASSSTTKGYAKRAAQKVAKTLSTETGLSKRAVRNIVGDVSKTGPGKTFVNEISKGLRADDKALSLSAAMFDANLKAAFKQVYAKAMKINKNITTPDAAGINKLVTSFTDEFIGTGKHVNSISQWVEKAMKIPDTGIKRFAGRYLGKATELSTDFMIYNQVSSAIADKYLEGPEWNPGEVALHTLAFTAVLPFIEMLPGGKSALAGGTLKDIKAVRKVLNRRTDFAKLSEKEVNGLLSIVARGTELENYKFAQDYTMSSLTNGTVSKGTAIKVLEYARENVNKDLKKWLVKETAADIIQSSGRMGVGAAFFNSDLVTDANMWKNTSPEEITTHLLIGAWFMRRRGLPISQEKMAKAHILGEGYRSKLRLATELGYDTTQIGRMATVYKSKDLRARLAAGYHEDPAFKTVYDSFIESDVLKDSKKGDRYNTLSPEALRKRITLYNLYENLIRPGEIAKHPDRIKEEHKIDFSRLTESQINNLYEKVMKVEIRKLDVLSNEEQTVEGKPVITTIKEEGAEEWKRQLTFGIAKQFKQDMVETAEQLAGILEIGVGTHTETGRRIFRKALYGDDVTPENLGELKRYEELVQRLYDEGVIDISDTPFDIKNVTEDQKARAKTLIDKVRDLVIERNFGEDFNIDLDLTDNIIWDMATHNSEIATLEYAYRVMAAENSKGLPTEDAAIHNEIRRMLVLPDNKVLGNFTDYRWRGEPDVESTKTTQQEKEDFISVKEQMKVLYDFVGEGHMKLDPSRVIKKRVQTIDYAEAKALVNTLHNRGFTAAVITEKGLSMKSRFRDYFWSRLSEDRGITPEMTSLLSMMKEDGVGYLENGRFILPTVKNVELYLAQFENIKGSKNTKLIAKYKNIISYLKPGEGIFVEYGDLPEGAKNVGDFIESTHNILPGIYEGRMKAELLEVGALLQEGGVRNEFQEIRRHYEDLVGKEEGIDREQTVANLGDAIDNVLESKTLQGAQRTTLENIRRNLKQLSRDAINKKGYTDDIIEQFNLREGIETFDLVTMVRNELNGYEGKAKSAMKTIVQLLSFGSVDMSNRNKVLKTQRKMKSWFMTELQKKDKKNIDQTSLTELYSEYVESLQGKGDARETSWQRLEQYIKGLQRQYIGIYTQKEYEAFKKQGMDLAHDFLKREDIMNRFTVNMIAQELDPEGGILNIDGEFSREWRTEIANASLIVDGKRVGPGVQATLDKFATEVLEPLLRAKLLKENPKLGGTLLDLKIVEAAQEFEKTKWPVLVKNLQGSIKRQAVRIEIIGDKIKLIKDQKFVMRGSKDDIIEILMNDAGLQVYDLYSSGYVDGYAYSVESIRKIDQLIRSGKLSDESLLLNELKDQKNPEDRALAEQTELENQRVNRSGWLRVEFGQGSGLIVERDSGKIGKLVQEWYVKKLNAKTPQGDPLMDPIQQAAFVRLFSKFAKAGEFNDSELRVALRAIYLDKINTYGFNKMLHGLDAIKAKKIEAKVFKYVHLSESDRYPRGNRSLLRNIASDGFTMEIDGNPRKIETGVPQEVRDAINAHAVIKPNKLFPNDPSKNILDYEFKVFVYQDEAEITDRFGNISQDESSPFHARGQLRRKLEYEMAQEMSKEVGAGLAYSSFDMVGNRRVLKDQNGNVSEDMPKFRRIWKQLKDVNDPTKNISLDSSNVNSQAYLSETAARTLFSLQGKGLLDGMGGLKPTMVENGDYSETGVISTLIGKTNFIYDPKIAAMMKNKGIHILLPKSAAKQYNGRIYDFSRGAQIDLTKDKNELLSDLFERELATVNTDDYIRKIAVDDINVGPAASELHGAKYLGVQANFQTAASVKNFIKRAQYKETAGQYENFIQNKESALFTGVGQALAQLPAEELHAYQSGSFGLAERMLAYGMQANDPLIAKDIKRWYHSRYMDKFRNKKALGAVSVARPGLGQAEPLYGEKTIGSPNDHTVEIRQFRFGGTNVAYALQKEKVKNLHDLSFAFEYTSEVDGRRVTRDVAGGLTEDGKWRFDDPELNAWEFQEGVSKQVWTEIKGTLGKFEEAYEAQKHLITKNDKKSKITLEEVFNLLKSDPMKNIFKAVGMRKFSLLDGVYRIPRKHISDIALNRIESFAPRNMGNTQSVGITEVATKHQGDFDVDKYNSIVALGHASTRDAFRHAGIVEDSYTRKDQRNLNIDIFETGNNGSGSAGSGKLIEDGVGKMKKNIDDARKNTGPIIKLQGSTAYLSNLELEIAGIKINSVLGPTGKSVGQRIANIAQTSLDIYEGFHPVTLMERKDILRYILFNEIPSDIKALAEVIDVKEFNHRRQMQNQTLTSSREYTPLFDFTEGKTAVEQRILQDAIIEMIQEVGKLQKLFPGTYEDGVQREMEYSEVRKLYKNASSLLHDPSHFVLRNLARANKDNPEYLRDLVKVFYGEDVRAKHGKTPADFIDALKMGKVPQISENIIVINYNRKNTNKDLLMDILPQGYIIRKIAKNNLHNTEGGVTSKQKDLDRAADIFSTKMEEHIDLIRAFGGEVVDKETGKFDQDIFDTVNEQVVDRINLREAGQLNLLAEVIDRDLRYTLQNHIRLRESKALPTDVRRNEDKIDALKIIKSYLDDKKIDMLDTSVGKGKDQYMFMSGPNKISRQRIKLYKPKEKKGKPVIHYVYEIRNNRIRTIDDIKKLQDIKRGSGGDSFLEDLLMFKGVAGKYRNVALERGKKYIVLKNPIDIRAITDVDAISGESMHYLTSGTESIAQRLFRSPAQVDAFYLEIDRLKRDLADIKFQAFDDAGIARYKSTEIWQYSNMKIQDTLRKFFNKYDNIDKAELSLLLLSPDPVLRALSRKGAGVYEPVFKTNQTLFKGLMSYLEATGNESIAKEIVTNYSKIFNWRSGSGLPPEMSDIYRPSAMLDRNGRELPFDDSMNARVAHLLAGNPVLHFGAMLNGIRSEATAGYHQYLRYNEYLGTSQIIHSFREEPFGGEVKDSNIMESTDPTWKAMGEGNSTEQHNKEGEC